MFKSTTLFIAVQCCQCSTMQVKQHKKNSKRWTCVICNQKQSVKKIYAQSYQAKDIRQFVQSFNMSRKVDNEQAVAEYEAPSLGHFVEHLEGSQVGEEHKPKRRTDWSEYVEDDEDSNPAYLKSLSNGREMFEPEIVTDIPDGLMFKNAKSKGKFAGSSSSSGLADNQTYKPQLLSKRDANKKVCISQVEATGKDADDSNLPGNFKRGQEQNKQMAVNVSKWRNSRWEKG